MEKKNKIKFDVKTAQINAQRKKERRNTIYAWILLVLFVFWTIGSILAFVNTFAGCSTSSTGYISAKADEGIAETALTGDEMNATINDFDITNYPSANYFNIENYKGTNGGWITVSNGVVNSIVVVASESTVYGVPLSTTLAEFCPELLVGETYTLSFELSSDLARNAIRLNSSGNSAGVYWYNGQSRTIDASDLSSPVLLYPLQSPGVMPDGKCVYSSIMINKGTEAMPYFPYFKSLYNAGYNDAELDIVGGFLTDSTMTAQFFYNAFLGEYSAPAIVYGQSGVIYSQAYNYFISEYDRYFRESEWFGVGLKFENRPTLSLVQDNLLALGQGFSFVNENAVAVLSYSSNSSNVGAGGIALPSTQYRCPLSFVPVEGAANTFTITIDTSVITSTSNLPLYVLSFENINIDNDSTRYTLLNSMQFRFKNTYYQEGYDAGYNEGMLSGGGYESGFQAGKIEGATQTGQVKYDEGYTVGYTDGFGAGKIEGAATANDYSFMSLISATIDAPIQAFTKMFDFEILGVNLTNFFLSLLSVGIVLVVLKLIFGGA